MTKSVAIVGAGIVGTTAAYQLSKKGIAVTVFDVGVGQATKAAAGIICPWLCATLDSRINKVKR